MAHSIETTGGVAVPAAEDAGTLAGFTTPGSAIPEVAGIMPALEAIGMPPIELAGIMPPAAIDV